MTLEQMQKQGRAKMNRPAHGICFEQEDILDQHTAATWKAALNSILESGLHEKLNQAMTLKVNKFNPETGEFIESVEFINGSNAEYRLDIETRKEITTLLDFAEDFSDLINKELL